MVIVSSSLDKEIEKIGIYSLNHIEIIPADYFTQEISEYHKELFPDFDTPNDPHWREKFVESKFKPKLASIVQEINERRNFLQNIKVAYTPKILQHAIENVLMHGNEEDPHKKVLLTTYYGENASIVSMLQEGEGFDFETKFQQFLEGEKYFENKGKGFQYMHATSQKVFYGEDGKSTNIIFRTQAQFPKFSTIKRKLAFE